MRRCGGFYIPLAPPLAQKTFPHSFKISYSNYKRTAGICERTISQIPAVLLLTESAVVNRDTSFRRQRPQKV